MRRKGIWLSVLATAMMAGSASAAPMDIETNGPLVSSGTWVGLDWGTYNETNNVEFLHGSVSTPYDWVAGYSDSDTDAHGDRWTENGALPGTAGGGQNYDAEAMFYHFDADNNYLHLAMITGFNPFGEKGDGTVAQHYAPQYYAGDLFVGFGTDPSYQLALGTALGTPSASGGTNLESTTRAGNAWIATTDPWMGDPLTDGLQPVTHDGNPNGTPDFSQANPYRVLAGHSNVGVYSTTVDYAYTRLWNGGGADPSGTPNGGIGNNANERWLYEYRIFIDPNHSVLGPLLGNGALGLHWTMGCGNDYFSHQDLSAFPPTVVPVPAAAPMVLLGMGAIGLVRRFRRNKQS